MILLQLLSFFTEHSNCYSSEPDSPGAGSIYSTEKVENV